MGHPLQQELSGRLATTAENPESENLSAEFLCSVASRLSARLQLQNSPPDNQNIDELHKQARVVGDAISSAIRLLKNLPDFFSKSTQPADSKKKSEEAISIDFSEVVSVAPPEEFDVDSLVSNRLGPSNVRPMWTHDIENTCAMLTLQLNQTREHLRTMVRTAQAAEMSVEVDEARRRTLKALTLVGSFLKPFLPPQANEMLTFAGGEDVQTSLLIRDAYFALLQEIDLLLSSSSDRSSDAIAHLMENVREVFGRFRLSRVFIKTRAPDRHLMNTLLERVEHWFTKTNPQVDEASRILADVSSFVQLLSGINNRSLLVDHDRLLVSTARDRLIDLRATLELSRVHAWETWRSILLSLQEMRWRDPSLDELVTDELILSVGSETDLRHRVDFMLEKLGCLRF